MENFIDFFQDTEISRLLELSRTSKKVNKYAISFLTLKVLVTTIDAQWEWMGDVGSARYEPALLPPCPTITVFSSVTSKFSEIQYFKG